MELPLEDFVISIKRQSDEDLSSAYVLHKSSNYGNAAFLTQQALEKAFKHVMMKIDIVDPHPGELKGLGHNPEIKVFNELKKYNEFKLENKVEDQIRLAAYERLPSLKDLFLAKNSSLLPDKIWWKISLEIELTAKEEKKARRDIKKELDSLANALQKIRDMYLQINNKKSERASILKKVLLGLQTIQNVTKNASVKLTITEYSKIQMTIRNVFHDLLTSFFKNVEKLDKKIIGTLTISAWIAIHSLTILKIASHKQLSRYPDEISPGVLSSSLYDAHADQLFALIQEVDAAISELYDVGEYAWYKTE